MSCMSGRPGPLGSAHYLRSGRLIVRWARSNHGLTLIELLDRPGGHRTSGGYRAAPVRQLHGAGADRAGPGRHRQPELRDPDLRGDERRLPNNLFEIGRATLLDSWGRPYEHLNFSLGTLGQQRKDLALVPINTDFDLYSKGKDGASQPPLTASASRDDIVRANDGQFIGLASNY
jgi:hypothetical protein